MGPPQSKPVSFPFLTPSLHAAGTHTEFLQFFDKQSSPVEHLARFAHGEHGELAPPPQSTSVSGPFMIPSMHVAGLHTLLTSSQLFDAQSVPTAQTLPLAQGKHVPPQSMSVSSPFLYMSLHVEATH